MSDDSIAALKNFDRAHPIDTSTRAALEDRMLAVLDDELDTANGPTGSRPPNGVETYVVQLELVGPEPAPGDRPRTTKRSPRWRWAGMTAAAAVLLFAIVLWPTAEPQSTIEISADEPAGQAEPLAQADGAPLVVDELPDIGVAVQTYCSQFLDPLAVALDSSRVNPTAQNALAVETTLGIAVRELDDLVRQADPAFDVETEALAEAMASEDLTSAEQLDALVATVSSAPGSEECRLDRFAEPYPIGGFLPDPPRVDGG